MAGCGVSEQRACRILRGSCAKVAPVVHPLRNTIVLPAVGRCGCKPIQPTAYIAGIAASISRPVALAPATAVIGNQSGDRQSRRAQRSCPCWMRWRGKLGNPYPELRAGELDTTLELILRGSRRLVFFSRSPDAGRQPLFGSELALLEEARAAALSLKRGTIGDNVSISRPDRQRALRQCASVAFRSVRARGAPYAGARRSPAADNSCGLHRADISFDASRSCAPSWDHFCGSSWAAEGVDVCYTTLSLGRHDDMAPLLTCCTPPASPFVMGVPGSDTSCFRSKHLVPRTRPAMRICCIAVGPECAACLDTGTDGYGATLRPGSHAEP